MVDSDQSNPKVKLHYQSKGVVLITGSFSATILIRVSNNV